jgi:hypothetical protein
LVAEYAITSFKDIAALAVLSSCITKVIGRVTADGNAVVYLLEFQRREPQLFAFLSQPFGASTPPTWRERVNRVSALRQGERDEAPPAATKGGQLSKPVDVILYNHPSNGFSVNIGMVQQSVLLYGIRRNNESSNGDQASYAEIALRDFDIPAFVSGAPAPGNATDSNVLILVSIDGKSVCDYHDFNELTSAIRSAGELCRWRFFYYPKLAWSSSGVSSGLGSVPLECKFGRFLVPQQAPPQAPPQLVEVPRAAPSSSRNYF